MAHVLIVTVAVAAAVDERCSRSGGGSLAGHGGWRLLGGRETDSESVAESSECNTHTEEGGQSSNAGQGSTHEAATRVTLNSTRLDSTGWPCEPAKREKKKKQKQPGQEPWQRKVESSAQPFFTSNDSKHNNNTFCRFEI